MKLAAIDLAGKLGGVEPRISKKLEVDFNCDPSPNLSTSTTSTSSPSSSKVSGLFRRVRIRVGEVEEDDLGFGNGKIAFGLSFGAVLVEIGELY